MMTKEEWIAACAAQYVKRAGMTEDEATLQAEAAWDTGVEFEGSEEAVLAEDPTEYADGDMNCWEDDE